MHCASCILFVSTLELQREHHLCSREVYLYTYYLHIIYNGRRVCPSEPRTTTLPSDLQAATDGVLPAGDTPVHCRSH